MKVIDICSRLVPSIPRTKEQFPGKFRFTSPKVAFKKQLNHKEKRDPLEVFKGAFNHLRVITGIQLGTAMYNQKLSITSYLYNTDPLLGVTGKATTGAIAAAARTNATETCSLIRTMLKKEV